MITITNSNLKITYESTFGHEDVTATLYWDGKAMTQTVIPKHIAFDDMQEKIAEGWKQGA